MNYNRADINDTLRVAKAISCKTRKVQYVFATGCGFLISKKPPDFAQAHYYIEQAYIEKRPT